MCKLASQCLRACSHTHADGGTWQSGVHRKVYADQIGDLFFACPKSSSARSLYSPALLLRQLAPFDPRVIFRRGRECDGDAYIMFTGTADQQGGDKSGDRLIK